MVIIEDRGKQYKVKVGDILKLPKISDCKAKDKIKFDKIIFIEKDLSNLKNIDEELNLKAYYLTKFKEVIFINNAASINPIERIGNFNDEAVFKLVQLNTIAPILLTNNIIKNNKSKLIRIFNISSGAAKTPIAGWGLYCSTKSANEMFFNTLKLQEVNNKLAALKKAIDKANEMFADK